MAERLDIESILRSHPSRFEPKPFYSPEGDSIHFYFENVDHYAERVDCWLTIYRSFEDQHLVGFKLKNIKSLVSAFDKLGLDIRVSHKQWSIKLLAAIAFCPWIEPESATRQPYRDLLSRIKSDETVGIAV